MFKIILSTVIFAYSLGAMAEKPAGFLWYNLPKKEIVQTSKAKEKRFKSLSFSDRDSILHFYTMEALHKARQTKKVEDMKAFLSLQNYWLKESSKFQSLFQKTMLVYPEYDYTVTHPNSSLGSKLTDDLRVSQKDALASSLSKTHGLLFFYRGKNPYDLKQIPIIKDFSTRFHFSLIPVSVDEAISEDLPATRKDSGQANRLGVRFFPALLLVNPKTKDLAPIAYGLVTQDVLLERLEKVATNFKGEA